MAIQKKSLISNMSTLKKAIIARDKKNLGNGGQLSGGGKGGALSGGGKGGALSGGGKGGALSGGKM